jgi:hypothetical protein
VRRRDEIDQQERRQREAVLAEFDAGNTDATQAWQLTCCATSA